MRIRSMTLALAAFALAAQTAYAASYADGTVKSMKTDKGSVLTDAKGMTLYTFDKDEKGVSNCYDQCAKAWPPLTAGKDAMAEGKLTLVARKDGSRQWAYSGMPLYLWQKDAKPGDTTGDGMKGIWHVVKD